MVTYRVTRNFCGSLILRIDDFFCILRELIFGSVKDWFFLLNILIFSKITAKIFAVIGVNHGYHNNILPSVADCFGNGLAKATVPLMV